MRLRSGLYRAARGLGDAKAVTSGRIAQRAANKAMGRAYGRVTGGGCLLPVLLALALVAHLIGVCCERAHS